MSIRLKRLDSIRQKIMRRGANFALGQLDDIVGVRVVCQSLSDACALKNRMEKSSNLHRLKDYMDDTGHGGYRSAHCIMRFDQPISKNEAIGVRFEIQVRSYYQHQWAVWSESLGEDVKVGMGAESVHSDLSKLAERIANWELHHPGKIQSELPVYAGGKSIAVARRGKPEPMLSFHPDVDSAVKYVNYLETRHYAFRRNVLLLVGAATREEAKRILRKTHPLYTMSRVIPPEYWMPPGS